MCGRFVLKSTVSQVRDELTAWNQNISVVDDQQDDQIPLRQSYNFAPGNVGLVIRSSQTVEGPPAGDERLSCRFDAMQWGLVPSWLKKQPDSRFIQSTINCRDDTLASGQSMWTSMRRAKRCVVVCDGFYEWRKLNGSKDRIPFYISRKDGKMMYFAGLWDCARYTGSKTAIYTFTIVTTSSNKQLNFIHHRMPVILDPESADLVSWLNCATPGWSHRLEEICKPYANTTALNLDQVGKEVGKVSNDTPSLIAPIASTCNKQNIANYFVKREDDDGVAVQSNVETDDSARPAQTSSEWTQTFPSEDALLASDSE